MKSVVSKIVLVLSLFNFTMLNGQVGNGGTEEGYCQAKGLVSLEPLVLSDFVPVICESDIDNEFVIELQEALIGKGYLDVSYEIIETAANFFDRPKVILKALKEYQLDNDFVRAGFTLESLTALGIDY